MIYNQLECNIVFNKYNIEMMIYHDEKMIIKQIHANGDTKGIIRNPDADKLLKIKEINNFVNDSIDLFKSFHLRPKGHSGFVCTKKIIHNTKIKMIVHLLFHNIKTLKTLFH
ncbi:MAG: hypothetical protein S4CHLAM123_06460 [Chlamydiales bacterium]|nr:hypothetical protein [Chlamydiales bacterium]